MQLWVESSESKASMEWNPVHCSKWKDECQGSCDDPVGMMGPTVRFQK